MWKCDVCNAMVSDLAGECPMCGIRGTTGNSPAIEPSGGTDAAEEEKGSPLVDAEGLTPAERLRERPLREVADSHLLLAQRTAARDRRRALRRKPGLFDDAVVPGSVRTSRPIFFWPMK